MAQPFLLHELLHRNALAVIDVMYGAVVVLAASVVALVVGALAVWLFDFSRAVIDVLFGREDLDNELAVLVDEVAEDDLMDRVEMVVRDPLHSFWDHAARDMSKEVEGP
jgi:hypothetical protein